jgi:hypothetical protein
MKFWKRQMADPIRGLTQKRLKGQIESYNNGYLAEFALTAEAMEQRDDILKNVVAKRKKAVTRHGWDVLAENCSEEALAQQEALDYFYRNLTATHVLRANEAGGFQLLVYPNNGCDQWLSQTAATVGLAGCSAPGIGGEIIQEINDSGG